MKRVIARILYGIGLIGMVLFVSNCDFCYEPSPTTSWVTCIDGHPVLTNGDDQADSAPNFDPSKYECPKNDDSPIWRGSGTPTYGTKPIKNSAARAAATTTTFLPPTILDLPFFPQSWSTTKSNAVCSSSAPDVLQVHHTNSLVTRFSTCPFAIRTTIPVASRPLQIAITPDGLTAIVTSYDNAINFIDLTTNRVTFTMSVGFYPHGIAITSDGTKAYVSNFDNSEPIVAVIDVAAHTVLTAIPVAAYPQSVFLTPDDSQLYVLFPFTNAIYIVDTVTNQVANTVAIPAPRDIAFNSLGTKAFITSASGSPGSVHQFNTETFKVEKIYPVGLGPTDIAVLYGDFTVVVNNYEGKSVSRINLSTGAVTTKQMSGSPIGMSIVR